MRLQDNKELTKTFKYGYEKWNILNRIWRNYVEKDFTNLFIKESVKINLYIINIVIKIIIVNCQLRIYKKKIVYIIIKDYVFVLNITHYYIKYQETLMRDTNI